ncbi:MAG TPA: RsmE family RNA methyltransferase [Candidatus Manganitrophaceae bacterium]|nr:RsmE family RNA methyltransferase [Candidatus Manganitrophaceae bacterium]
MPVYFIRSEQIDRGKIVIGGDLAHHLRDVLRLREGETLFLVDEIPKRYFAKMVGRDSGRLLLEILREENAPAERLPKLRLGVGLLKGEKMEWIFQKATELGVSRISPLGSKRSEVRPKAERFDRQRGRWMKIATEAAQQSGRWDIPQIDPPSDLHAFVGETASYGFKLIFWEKAPVLPLRPLLEPALRTSRSHGALLIGPEGGWETSEVEEAARQGYLPVSLGPRTLRAETACLAALSILQYELENSRKEGPRGNH